MYILIFLLVGGMFVASRSKIGNCEFPWSLQSVSSLNNHSCISHCKLVGCIPYPLSSFDNYISSFPCACRLFGFNAGKLRMDERIDLSMSDPDLVPLLIQVLSLHFYWVWSCWIAYTAWWSIGPWRIYQLQNQQNVVHFLHFQTVTGKKKSYTYQSQHGW